MHSCEQKIRPAVNGTSANCVQHCLPLGYPSETLQYLSSSVCFLVELIPVCSPIVRHGHVGAKIIVPYTPCQQQNYVSAIYSTVLFTCTFKFVQQQESLLAP
uniref:Uncharacterized protein n=1 Tax=Sipha flava TaxID=143950 RepID=A0A2S2QHC3_9HEMI